MDLLDFGLKPLSSYLSKAVLDEVRRRSHRRSFIDQQALHRRGEDEARLCIVADGMVRFGRFQHDGSFKLLAMLGRGAHYGDVALQRQTFTQNVFAVGRTEIDVIDAVALENFLRDHPELAIAIWRCNTARLNAVLELYDDARTLNVTARLAKVIYVHTGRGELPNGVACLQSDLAELVKQVRAKIDELGIQYIYYQFISVTGRVVGKGVPADHWEAIAAKGIQLVYGSMANLYVDRHRNYIGYGPEAAELVAIPDPETFCQLPWDKRVARVYCVCFRNREEETDAAAFLTGDCRGNFKRIHAEFQAQLTFAELANERRVPGLHAQFTVDHWQDHHVRRLVENCLLGSDDDAL